jgi:hypothetical protein
MSTDLIKVPQFTRTNTNNGTLYNFSQLNNDLAKAIANTNSFERVPSKFVCIKLPNWGSAGLRKMFIEPDKIVPSGNVTDPNVLFPALLQNYIENFYAYAKSDDIQASNVTEWALWKLLHNLGAIKLTSASNGDTIDDIEGSIIQYVGDINVVNYVEYGNRTYTEQYLHIPSTATKSTINFAKSINTTAKLPINGAGQDASLGLEISAEDINNAVYDFDELGNSINYYDLSQQWSKTFLNFSTASQTNSQEDFDFNCILLYYDTYEVDALGNKQNYETKLGSILLLDSFERQLATNEWSIKTVTKYNDATSNTAVGNAIAYRLCTNFFSTNEQSVIDTIVNDYNTVSMDLYVHALQKMLETGELFKNSQVNIEAITEQLAALNYGTTLLKDIETNKQLLNSLTDKVNSLIGSNGYTVTNFQLLDAFAKLSNDFKGDNGPNVNNTFVFNQGTTNAGTVNFNEPYVYSENGKYSIAYSEESMLSVALLRNKVLSKYAINSSIVNNYLRLTLVSSDASNISYCADYKLYNNAANNQYVELSFATNSVDAKHYILVINKNTGILECRTYASLKKIALKDFAYVADFVLPTIANFNQYGLSFSNNVSTLMTNTFNVLLNNDSQGTYNTGDTIYAGEDVKTVVAKMLVDYSLLNYKQPSIDISINNRNAMPQLLATRQYAIQFNQNDAGSLNMMQITSNQFKAFCTFSIRHANGKYYIRQYETSDATAYSETLLTANFTSTASVFQFKIYNGFLYIAASQLVFDSVADNIMQIDLQSEFIAITDITSILAEADTNTISTVYEFNIASRISYSTSLEHSTITVQTRNSYAQSKYLTINAVATYNSGQLKYFPTGEVIQNSIQAGSISNYKTFKTLETDILVLNTFDDIIENQLIDDIDEFWPGYEANSNVITYTLRKNSIALKLNVLCANAFTIEKAFYDNNQYNDVTAMFANAPLKQVFVGVDTPMFCKTIEFNASFLFDTNITIMLSV